MNTLYNNNINRYLLFEGPKLFHDYSSGWPVEFALRTPALQHCCVLGYLKGANSKCNVMYKVFGKYCLILIKFSELWMKRTTDSWVTLWTHWSVHSYSSFWVHSFSLATEKTINYVPLKGSGNNFWTSCSSHNMVELVQSAMMKD